MDVKYDRLIIQMDDVELEKFCRNWVSKKSDYVEVYRHGSTGDKGRDVVGFLSPQRHEGAWDNFQCKQYRRNLNVDEGLLAVGKVLYWAFKGEFTVPRKFYFVAPRGLNQKLQGLVDKPSEFKKALIEKWDLVCAKKIVEDVNISLSQALRDVIDAFDFEQIHKIAIDDVMADTATVPLLFELFGRDPGDYPPGVVPPDIRNDELKYLRALVDAYGERDNTTYNGHADVLAHPIHGSDIRDHRESYFEADAFQKFYRDNTSATIITRFRKDIHFGIKDKLKATADDSLARVQAVMAQAATVVPGGPLAKYAYVPVKQGICHHLVNDDEISWKAP